MFISALLISCGVFMTVSGAAIVDPVLKEMIYSEPTSTHNIIISFNQSTRSVIQQINDDDYPTVHERRHALTEAQQEFANSVQRPLQQFLESKLVDYETFWINNKMYISNVDGEMVNVLANFPGVAKIEKELVLKWRPLNAGEPVEYGIELGNHSVQWGISMIKADQVWKTYNGKGVVVANIDSGVRYTHEALSGRWRKEYGWYDAYSHAPRPYDDYGHGTHTMSISVGAKGVGVAPGATWIACKACNPSGCNETALIRCGQWIQCPTDWLGNHKNCTMAPDVVSNSWGEGQGKTFYDDVMTSWHKSGIIFVFSTGDPKLALECGTVQSPGDRPNVISVGCINMNESITGLSSFGPSKDGKIKPDLVAPGQRILAAWPSSDAGYMNASGSATACPHVSGVIALLRQKVPHLPYDKVYKAITSTAYQFKGLGVSLCGKNNAVEFPNNLFGHGRIDALNAVNAVNKTKI